jgi:hypothetical protein
MVLGGLVHIAKIQEKDPKNIVSEEYHQHNLILISSIYPIRGGAIIGIYRPFMECPLQDR